MIMKADKLKAMSKDELLKQEKELKAELFNLRFQSVRIKTVLRARELGQDAE